MLSLCVAPTLGRFADVADGEDKIPLQNVDARILAKVIEYMKYHFKLTETPQPEDEVRRWDREFVRVDKSTLFHLVLVRSFAQLLARCPMLQGLLLEPVFSGLLPDAVLCVVPSGDVALLHVLFLSGNVWFACCGLLVLTLPSPCGLLP